MRVINLIDNFTKVNFGIWNAAISTASNLKKDYEIESELWFPQVVDTPDLADVIKVPLADLSTRSIEDLIARRNLKPDNCIIVTHGCWQFPTRWGAAFKKKGFHWVYVPHGMLEPWSMQQKAVKKAIYFKLVEQRLSKKADSIRAVGTPEYTNLIRKYSHAALIPNGIEVDSTASDASNWKNTDVINYLFMARIHHKKGIAQLVEAWIQSPQGKTDKAHLYIAGPDDGELATILPLIQSCPSHNITYTGAIYNKAKQTLINKCHIYMLPSHSEGFPTSVLEAMNNHLLTVITDGCNFPEAFEKGVAIRTTPHKEDILDTLCQLHTTPLQKLTEQANQGAHFTQLNYSLEKISHQQVELYRSLVELSMA